MKTCKKFQVTGRVQGVWFRDSTRREALNFGLTGYAHNMFDGSVEVLACGDSSAVAKLAQWLHSGPRMARVDSVTEVEFEGECPLGFSIG